MHRSSSRHFLSGGRYPALRAFGILYLILACLSVLGGIGWAIYYAATAQTNLMTRLFVSGEILAGAFFACVSLLMIAEVVKLFIDMEHNTRTTAMALAMRGGTQSAVVAGPATSVVAPDPALTPTGTVVSDGHVSRVEGYFHSLDEETAEAALLRGH